MDTNLEIIALSGKAGTGKDYLYDHFFRPRKYLRFALADHFKIWAVGRNLLTYEEAFVTKPPHVRKILQLTGTEEGRNVYGIDIWCQVALAWLEHFHKTLGLNKWIITDIRFKNEVEFVQRNGGKVFRIIAPLRAENNKLTPEQRQHPSETELDDFTEFDGYIHNDFEYESSVAEQITTLLTETGCMTT